MGDYALDELAGHVGGGLGGVVEGGHDGVDGGSGLGGEGHIAEVDEAKWGFTDTEDKRSALLEGDVGGAVDEGVGEAVGDGGEGSHGAGEDEHGVRGVGAGGYVGADVFVGVLLDFEGGGAEELFGEVVAAGEPELLGDYAEGGVGDYEVDVLDAGVCGEEAEGFGGEEAAGGSGDGEGEDFRGKHT